VSALPDRALMLTSPWWWFMLHLPAEIRKDLENRPTGFSHKSFRGPVWVHAGAASSMSRPYYDEAVHFATQRRVPLELIPSFKWFQQSSGAIVGRFTITDMLRAPDLCRLPDGWRMAGCIAFVTTEPVVCTPVPCKGALGFWRVPPAALEQLSLGKTNGSAPAAEFFLSDSF
jgi:hypothetical protein